MTPPPGTPSDWVSGERVFAPPRGTVDVDWLVPAVVELVPGAAPAQARAALERAWLRRRTSAPPPPDPAAGDALGRGAAAAPPRVVGTTDLDAAAEQVVAEALEIFGA